jgi:cytochrome c biogenesis protein CcdA
MEFLILSFVAGMLTVLAPCILPVLPVVIGGSLSDKHTLRPFIITFSLGISIIVFTLLLKVSTLLIDIPRDFWKWISGGIVFFFGFMMIFPNFWKQISLTLGFSSGSQKLLSHAGYRKGIGGMILIGASLGPVFASCSPIYFIILATLLPANFSWGLMNLIAYGMGLSVIMFLIAFLGQKILSRFRWATDLHGTFRKGIGVLFLIVGIAIFTGYEKKLESQLLDMGFNTTSFEEKLVEKFYSPDVR